MADADIRNDLLTTATSPSIITSHIVPLLLLAGHSQHDRTIQLNALTALHHLHTVDAQRCCPLICTAATLAGIRQLASAGEQRSELRTLAAVFLDDFHRR